MFGALDADRARRISENRIAIINRKLANNFWKNYKALIKLTPTSDYWYFDLFVKKGETINHNEKYFEFKYDHAICKKQAIDCLKSKGFYMWESVEKTNFGSFGIFSIYDAAEEEDFSNWRQL